MGGTDGPLVDASNNETRPPAHDEEADRKVCPEDLCVCRRGEDEPELGRSKDLFEKACSDPGSVFSAGLVSL